MINGSIMASLMPAGISGTGVAGSGAMMAVALSERGSGRSDIPRVAGGARD